MITLCFVAFCFVLCLSFIFSFILHPSCIIILVHSFISCPIFSLALCLFVSKRGRVYSRVVYWRVLSFLYDSCAHLQGERYSIRGMHIPRERRHCVNKKTFFCLCVEHAFILMLLCYIDCMFGWSFALLCDHCNHFFMTVLVYDQVAHMFHIMFTWTQFTCYIILVCLLLALLWGFDVFYASVSGYKYICSKFITAPMIHDRGSDMIREVLYSLYLLLL